MMINCLMTIKMNLMQTMMIHRSHKETKKTEQILFKKKVSASVIKKKRNM